MAALKDRLLGPPPPVDAGATGPLATGRARHLTLLERYQDADVLNLLAYLRRGTSSAPRRRGRRRKTPGE